MKKVDYSEAVSKHVTLWKRLNGMSLPDDYIDALVSDMLVSAGVAPTKINNEVRHLASHALALKLETWSLNLDHDNRPRPNLKIVK